MIKPLQILILLQWVCLLGAVICNAGVTPKWINQRPRLPDYYVGIGMAEKSDADDYKQRAKSNALLDLAHEISVAVSGTFVENIVEKTGLSEKMVRSEIRLSSTALIHDHELVDQWEDDDIYWVYYRLSKKRYHKRLNRRRATASKLAADMFQRAVAAGKDQKIVSALRFDYQALQQLSDFLGESIEIKINGRTQPLGNAIYAHLQGLMTAIRISSAQPEFPVFMGNATPANLSVTATISTDSRDSTAVAKLPIQFSFPRPLKNTTATRYTDQYGRAHCRVGFVKSITNSPVVTVSIDTKTLFPKADLVLEALLKKVSRPQTTIRLMPISDPKEFLWRQKFQGRNVAVLSAYQIGERAVSWPKFYNEMTQHLKSVGANIIAPPSALSVEKIIELSDRPEKVFKTEALEETEIVIIVTAQGKLNQRKNPQNPFGEDVQFAGEFYNVVQRDGVVTFTDRYRAMSGYNPMGEKMCMEVTALNVFKRFKARYLKQLGRK